MAELYLGLISGTSADGIDAVVVDFSAHPPQLIAQSCTPYPTELRQQILTIAQRQSISLAELGSLDVLIGREFAKAANQLLASQELKADHIRAIGSHGQNIFHHPQGVTPFTLQIGDPNIIAANTGITTVADFRRKDVALGGQGAPLVPAFHQALFRGEQDRVIVNIGGIANITVLPADKNKTTLGYDTGPGNALLDSWIEQHLQQSHDIKGQWAAKGNINEALLKQLLADNYFKLAAPKSTGREYFNLTWLQPFLIPDISAVDVQATLVELTALSILQEVKKHFTRGEILICGGGAHNDFLRQRLRVLAEGFSVATTEIGGVAPDWVEAMAFAWLAKQTLEHKPGNLPQVTGAQRVAILGGIYYV